jgi:alpha-L-arabinofuranosidase-like protein
VKGTAQLTTDRPFVGRQSQRLIFDSGDGAIGIENRGLNRWGLHFVGGKTYEGIIWARAPHPVELLVKLESGDGSRLLAETKLVVTQTDWQRFTFELTPSETQSSARLTLALANPGSVELGYAFLQPGEWGRFKGLPIRRDVTEGLIDQGITVLRYGGSMINHSEYRWKKMIGARDRRPPNAGTWYAHSTNGWGILDFLDLCEAAGFASIPAFNMDETPQDIGDFIDYVNGPATSEWGRKRAAAGHPQPYGLKHIELGNEERIDDAYFAKFKPLAEEIWKRDPNITIVVGDFVYDHAFTNPFQITGAASGIKTLAGQQKILRLAKEHGHEVWFDIHIDTNGPRPRFGGMWSYLDALEELADGAKHRVVVFEFNSGNHSQRRALANAAAINAIERDGRIPIALSANCLQPDGQNDNEWNQGLLFLNPSQVWLQPPGCVTQMFSRFFQPLAVRSDVRDASDGFDVCVKRSEDRQTLVLQVVNPNDEPQSSRIKLTGLVPRSSKATVVTLQGPLTVTNTAAQPGAIVPDQKHWPHGLANGEAKYVFPPRSVTVMRFD